MRPVNLVLIDYRSVSVGDKKPINRLAIGKVLISCGDNFLEKNAIGSQVTFTFCCSAAPQAEFESSVVVAVDYSTSDAPVTLRLPPSPCNLKRFFGFLCPDDGALVFLLCTRSEEPVSQQHFR